MKKTRNKVKKQSVVIAILAVLILLCRPMRVYALEATVTFGSNWYEKDRGEEFPIGVYIKADSPIASYHVELKYDNLRLQYISGADEVVEEEGLLIFDGTSESEEIKYWLTFDTVSGGEASLAVISAEITDANNETTTVTELQSVPIHLSGEDTAAENVPIEPPIEGQAPEEGENPTEEIGSEIVQNTEEEINTEANQMQIEEDDKPSNKDVGRIVRIVLIVVLGIVCILAIAFAVIYIRERKRIQRRRKMRMEKNQQLNRLLEHRENEDDNEIEDMPVQVAKGLSDRQKEEPVIKVDDVTMKFRVSTSNASGIKEYLIQALKHQVSYRELVALNRVSFDVYKGEIVGIIGTNGSGKSTLLKIVSGALNPTSGQVIVDKRKIQLLTLGTGFDMELSARENVYLNGAIIGYSKEFLDEHYDEIVEFAELQDFMEEKVKNFSSGMVSRLGFAIATAGDAAEILILDEVLSVGDEFFRKKSLARVKEMIHGGSTVLMVSHSMSTILENCTKVVWIEKGVLKMIGEPKIVCAAYRNEGENR